MHGGFEAASRDSPRYLFVALFVQFGIKKKNLIGVSV